MLIDRFGGEVLVIVAVIVGNAIALEETNGFVVNTNRTGKYLRTFDRGNCLTQSGFSGTCITKSNCNRNGGLESGSCGVFGNRVCCADNIQCGQVTNLKRTLIQTPNTLAPRCAYIIKPHSLNVCQIKIEMEEFRLQQPQIGNTLECTDSFEVNGMKLCGNNNGQHLYIPFDVTSGIDANVNLVFNIANRNSDSRWRLILTQLECPTAKGNKGLPQDSTSTSDLTMLAPHGCTQYFTERSGTFESFNYNGGGGPYMANLNYAICFQRQFGDSAIEFSFMDFGLPNHGANNGYDADCHPLIPTLGKQDDYLMIPGATVVGASTLQPIYFCGTDKQGMKATYGAPGPFAIYFKSDQQWSLNNLGFKIKYTVV